MKKKSKKPAAKKAAVKKPREWVLYGGFIKNGLCCVRLHAEEIASVMCGCRVVRLVAREDKP